MSGVNSGNLAKLCEASMPKSCISRKHGICAFLEFADPSFTDQMSYVKNLFGFRAFLWYLTSGKNLMVIRSAVLDYYYYIEGVDKLHEINQNII